MDRNAWNNYAFDYRRIISQHVISRVNIFYKVCKSYILVFDTSKTSAHRRSRICYCTAVEFVCLRRTEDDV